MDPERDLTSCSSVTELLLPIAGGRRYCPDKGVRKLWCDALNKSCENKAHRVSV